MLSCVCPANLTVYEDEKKPIFAFKVLRYSTSLRWELLAGSEVNQWRSPQAEQGMASRGGQGGPSTVERMNVLGEMQRICMDTKNIPPHQYSRCRGLRPGSPQHLLLSFHTTACRARAFATPPVPLRTSSQVTRQPLLSKQFEKNFCDFLRNRQQCRTSIVDLAFRRKSARYLLPMEART